jgi:propanol-preferring alcohol dehydrogenase
VLGHELAGVVVAAGEGVGPELIGTAIVGFGPRGCGTCARCRRGAVNYCRDRPPGSFPPGLGSPGGLAEYVALPAGSVVDRRGVSAAQAAALSDAGLTAWHAVRRASPHPGDTVVVIGVGGLGHVAIQMLRRTADVRVVAVDVDESKLELARKLGADVCVRGDDVVATVRGLTDGAGADVVLDFVAVAPTLAAATAMLAVDGTLSIVGVSAARLPVGVHAVPFGTRVDTPFWGGRDELDDLLFMAETGQVRVTVEEIDLAEVAKGYRRLERGEVLGRLVAIPRREPRAGQP